MTKIKNLFYVLILSTGLAGCDNEPVRLEVIQSPLDVQLVILPNFGGVEFLEDLPLPIIVSIESTRIELVAYDIRVLDAITREPIYFEENPYPGQQTTLNLVLPAFKAGLYTVIVTVTDTNNFESAASANVDLPRQGFQEDFSDIWFKGTANQWQNNIKFDQVGNHVWQAQCVALTAGDEFILTSSPSNTECHWGSGTLIDQVGVPIAPPISCSFGNHINATQSPMIVDVPSGNYSISFDDETFDITLIPNDGCFLDQERTPMKIFGSAVTSFFPGADYFKSTSQRDQLVMYFETGTFQLQENDGSGAIFGGSGGDGILEMNGAPIGVEEGLYHLSLDDNTKDLVITPIGEVSIVGDLDWSIDRQMTQDPLSPWIWTVGGISLESGSIRFRANQSWDVSWGDPEGDILLSYGGGNIEVDGGTYEVAINLLANNYLLVHD